MAVSGQPDPGGAGSRVQVDCDGDCLRIRVTDEFNRGRATRFVDQLGGLSAKHGVSKVLLDCRGITGAFQVIERFEVGERIGTALPSSLRLAVLAAPTMVLPDRFMQTVANNRGANILVTTDPRDAAGWLGIAVEYVDSSS